MSDHCLNFMEDRGRIYIRISDLLKALEDPSVSKEQLHEEILMGADQTQRPVDECG